MKNSNRSPPITCARLRSMIDRRPSTPRKSSLHTGSKMAVLPCSGSDARRGRGVTLRPLPTVSNRKPMAAVAKPKAIQAKSEMKRVR